MWTLVGIIVEIFAFNDIPTKIFFKKIILVENILTNCDHGREFEMKGKYFTLREAHIKKRLI